jgi:hypothetical protein
LKFLRELVLGDREVQADSDDGPAVLGARLDQDARQLAAFEVDVVRPLDLAFDVGAEALRGLADREGDGEGEDRVAGEEGAEDRGVEERRVGRRGP